MRIEFPHSTREGFRWTQPQLNIGSESDNDLILAAAQAASHHLRIHQDRRGLVLEVLPGASRIYVNARPVRERAILRAGDIFSVGDSRMLICADEEPVDRAALSLPDPAECTAALRAVAGPLSGRVLSLRNRLELGPHSAFALELPQGEATTIVLCWRDAQLWLDTEQPLTSTYPVRLNGRPIQHVALKPGDQIGLAMHRFVIDAPGMEPEPEIPVIEAPRVALPEDIAGPRGEVWWLIVTAAVLALGIALMLLIRF